MPPGDHTTLPANLTFSYVAEGAANVVYKIHQPPAPPSVPEDRDENAPSHPDNGAVLRRQLSRCEKKLLRLRKDLPTTLPCAVSHAAWLRTIAPLFRPDQIVEQSLVELRPPGLITRLNAELYQWEQSPRLKRFSSRSSARPRSRQGIYLADDEHGLLVTDMTRSGNDEVVVEFKPKWLSQSHSAPPSSKRCRQCARVARANAERKRTGEPLRTLWCPLDLVSESRADLEGVAVQLLAPKQDPALATRLARWLETSPLLRQLCAAQKRLDGKGVLAGEVDERFLAAMTLRDCTVFIKFPWGAGGRAVEARLGDLDLKSAGKKAYWRATEVGLIEEGWYSGHEREEDRQPLTCQLSRGAVEV